MRCRPQPRLSITVLLLFVECLSARGDDKRAKEVEVPAFTAYVVPDNGGARIDPCRGSPFPCGSRISPNNRRDHRAGAVAGGDQNRPAIGSPW